MTLHETADEVQHDRLSTGVKNSLLCSLQQIIIACRTKLIPDVFSSTGEETDAHRHLIIGMLLAGGAFNVQKGAY